MVITGNPHEVLDPSRVEDASRIEELASEGYQMTGDLGLAALNLAEIKEPYLSPTDIAHQLPEDYQGVLVAYPWLKRLQRFPLPDDFWQLITERNRNLLTREELTEIRQARTAIFGLNTGSEIVRGLVKNGVGEAMAIGDFDTVDYTNLNRANMKPADVGSKKTDAVSKVVSEMNPFIDQTCFSEGFDQNTGDTLREFRPSIVFDQVDNMAISAMLRLFCKETRIPYITMADADRIPVLEVVRFDKDPKAKLFTARGISSKLTEKALANELTEKEQTVLFALSIGLRNLSPALVESALEVGKSLSGLPQRGTTTVKGSGYAAETAIDILVGKNKVSTGIYPLRGNAKLFKQLSLFDFAKVLRAFLRYSK